MPTLGIKGSSWATVADIGIAALLNLFFIKKYTAFTFEGRQLLKTALCAAVMGGAVMLVLSLVSRRRAGAFPQHLGCSARLYPDAPLAKDFDRRRTAGNPFPRPTHGVAGS